VIGVPLEYVPGVDRPVVALLPREHIRPFLGPRQHPYFRLSPAMLRVHLQTEPGVHRIEQGEAEQAPVFVFPQADDALGIVGDQGVPEAPHDVADVQVAGAVSARPRAHQDLGRAVFVAAEGRGMGDLMAQYFDRLNPGGRELYEEYSEIPPPESLERQAMGVETVIPDPDRLMPPATLGAY
jgi:hypothetical protein